MIDLQRTTLMRAPLVVLYPSQGICRKIENSNRRAIMAKKIQGRDSQTRTRPQVETITRSPSRSGDCRSVSGTDYALWACIGHCPCEPPEQHDEPGQQLSCFWQHSGLSPARVCSITPNPANPSTIIAATAASPNRFICVLPKIRHRKFHKLSLLRRSLKPASASRKRQFFSVPNVSRGGRYSPASEFRRRLDPIACDLFEILDHFILSPRWPQFD
jgi:hypothetical protein